MSTATLSRCLHQIYSSGFKPNIYPIIQITIFTNHTYSTDKTTRTAEQLEKAPSVLTLAHKIYGKTPFEKQNPPIIILHDVFGSKDHWDKIGRIINEQSKIPVVTVDLRNHGDSPHTTSHRYAEMAKDVIQLYKTLNIEQANLLGHSMGGRTAMCVALTTPWKVRSLLVEDVSPVSMSKVFLKQLPALYHAMESIDFSGIRSNRIDDLHVEKARYMAKEQLKAIIKDNDVLYTVLSGIIPDENGIVHWAYNLDTLKNCDNHIDTFPKDLRDKVYDGPTLFIAGDQSDFVPYGDIQQIKKMFPNADIKYITHAGHNVHVDNPMKFLEHTIKFFTNSICETVRD